MTENKFKKIINSSIKLIGANTLKSIISFAGIVVFSRQIGASQMGIYYPFIALVGAAAIPADFGVKAAVEKRISEGESVGDILSAALVLKWPLLLIIGSCLYAGRDIINTYLGDELALLVIVALGCREFARLGIFTLRGELRVGETALAKAVQPATWLVMGIVFLETGLGVVGIAYSYIISQVLMGMVAWARSSVAFGPLSLSNVKSIFEYGKFSIVSDAGGLAYNWLDVLILSAFISAGVASSKVELGAYENSWRISLLVLLFSSAIASILFPQFSQWDAEDARGKIEKLLPRAILPVMIVAIPAFVGSIVLSNQLLRILFGPEFTVASTILIILTGDKIFQSVHLILGKSLQALDRPDLSAYSTISSIFINIILNLLLIPTVGTIGAAIATTLSFFLNTVIHAYFLNMFVEIRLPILKLGWVGVSATAMGVLVYALDKLLRPKSILSLLLLVVISAALYAVALTLFKPIREDVVALSGSILRLLKSNRQV